MRWDGIAQCTPLRRTGYTNDSHSARDVACGFLILAPSSVLRAQAGGAIEIDGDASDAGLKARGLEHHTSILRDEPAAIEDEAIVGADEVGVRDDGLVVARACRDHLPARVHDPDAERRRRQVADELCAGITATAHRSVRGPQVLAHFDREHTEVALEHEVAEGHSAHLVVEASRPAVEGAALVEDVVGRQLLLRHEAMHASAMQHGSAVVHAVVASHGDTDDDHHGHVGGRSREAL